ncbi:MAG: 4Fe-4S binding protein, partial [Clostridiales bacterium]
SEFEQGLGKRKAIYKLFPQAVPSKPVIDKENCKMLKDGKCGVCAKICPTGAINFEDQDQLITENYGAIIVSTGYELIQWQKYYGEYGYGRYPDIITGLHFERLSNASGPTEGKILRPSDGQEPKDIVFIKCVGSRDVNKGKSYCSRACCMYTAKHAHQAMEKIDGARAYIFYMDIRTPGKGYDEFYMRTADEGAIYLRGRVSKIYQENGKLICLGEDTLSDRNIKIAADLVVLETAMVPNEAAANVASLLGLATDKDGWMQEAHPKLRPVETHTGGVFLAGTCQGPKDIPDTVAQASAAAAKVCALFSKDQMPTNPMISSVDNEKCSGCGICVPVCPYKAIELQDIPCVVNGKRGFRQVAAINKGLCQGCGGCTVNCRTGAIDLLGFTNKQILEEVDALCLK